MPIGRLVLSTTLMILIVGGTFVVLVATGRLALMPALTAALAILIVQFVLLRAFSGGLTEIRRGVAALLDGTEEPPDIRADNPAVAELWHAIVRLDRSARQRMAELRDDLAIAESVLAALPAPILLIDDRRRIVQTNAAARDLFGGNLDRRDLSAAIRNPAVLTATDTVLRSGAAQVIEFELNAPVERSLRAQVERLADGQRGALLSLTDLTTMKRAEQLRADFVANASHELRTPLSSVLGFIETLEGPAADDADARRRFLPIMRQQAARMARLVDDLLSLSRIELNEHMPPRGEVDLSVVLRTVAQALDLKAAARKMRIEIELASNSSVVWGDAEELSQVVQNLVDNAIKYGNEGTAVSVRLAPSGRLRQGLVVSVRDRGEGIARRHLPRLTERFYRVDTARSRAMGGTGLGLAIVKHIISRHRGQLDIASEVGEGSTFSVHLPAKAMTMPLPSALQG